MQKLFENSLVSNQLAGVCTLSSDFCVVILILSQANMLLVINTIAKHFFKTSVFAQQSKFTLK